MADKRMSNRKKGNKKRFNTPTAVDRLDKEIHFTNRAIIKIWIDRQ